MSVAALRSWLDANRPNLRRMLDSSSTAEGVERLNRETGLRLRFTPGSEHELCAQFLDAFKGGRMALSTDYQYYDARSDTFNTELKIRAMEKKLKAEMDAPKSITTPEPNKVLLLLGDTE